MMFWVSVLDTFLRTMAGCGCCAVGVGQITLPVLSRLGMLGCRVGSTGAGSMQGGAGDAGTYEGGADIG